MTAKLTGLKCEAMIIGVYVPKYVGGKKETRCGRPARYQFNDKCYCREHLGLIMVQKAEDEGKVIRI